MLFLFLLFEYDVNGIIWLFRVGDIEYLICGSRLGIFNVRWEGILLIFRRVVESLWLDFDVVLEGCRLYFLLLEIEDVLFLILIEELFLLGFSIRFFIVDFVFCLFLLLVILLLRERFDILVE